MKPTQFTPIHQILPNSTKSTKSHCSLGDLNLTDRQTNKLHSIRGRYEYTTTNHLGTKTQYLKCNCNENKNGCAPYDPVQSENG
jgi:hypothetical protein